MIAIPSWLGRASRYSVMLIGLLLVGYIGYLVLAQYRNHTELREAELKQVASDIERRALALNYFYKNVRDDLQELADSSELVSYFENRDLGMSMEYGLRSSLMMVQQLFERKHEKELVGEDPQIERIVFLDASGRKLVDAGHSYQAAEKNRTWSTFISPSHPSHGITCEVVNGEPKAIISVPAYSKQRYAGQILGWVSCDTAYRYFVEGSAPSHNPVCLLYNDRYIHVPGAAKELVSPTLLPSLVPGRPYRMPSPSGLPHDDAAYAVLVPAGNTPFSLLAFLLPSDQGDFRSPEKLLYTTGAIALFILGGMFIFLRINMRNAVLTAHLEETTLREQEVGEKNRQLADEIRERMLAEVSLQRERDFVETLFQTAQVIMLVVDCQGRIIRFNRYMSDLTGYDLHDVEGMDCFSVFLPEEVRQTHRERFQTTMQGNDPCRSCGPLMTKPGERRVVEWQDKPLRDSEGNLFGLLSVGQDVTERRKLEAEMIKAEKLESLGTLAGGIAHDFNNLLTAIMGNISVARALAASGDLRQRLTESETACKRAVGLTRQLLTFSKGGAPVRKATSLERIILESAGLALSGSTSKLRFSTPPGLWPAEVDAGQIDQVLHNLVINAAQAMPKGGVVSVACENVHVLHDDALPLPEGRYVRITVSDQGVGIPKQHLPKVFDPYFTTKDKGSGLGLASSFSIINNHGGLIIAESQEGSGSSFHVYLPASETEASPEVDEVKELKSGTGRILVMDDEAFVRQIIGIMLKKLGYDFGLTHDGDAALAEYRSALDGGRRYDAVIMDLTIAGGMGGVEAVQKLREIDPCVRAVVSSGYSNDPIMANFGEYGFKGVVKKPYTLEELDELLRNVLDPAA